MTEQGGKLTVRSLADWVRCGGYRNVAVLAPREGEQAAGESGPGAVEAGEAADTLVSLLRTPPAVRCTRLVEGSNWPPALDLLLVVGRPKERHTQALGAFQRVVVLPV